MDFDKLTALYKQVQKLNPLLSPEKEPLAKQKKYEHILSSNSLAGISLNKHEVVTLLETGITIDSKPFADYWSTLNLDRAYDYVQKLASQKVQLDEKIIRNINKLVTYSFDTSQPNEIPNKMEDLIKWYKDIEGKEHPVKIAALLHLKFVSIHPFMDGNGRTARLLMNFELVKHGYLIINIQPDRDSREAYMKALQVAQTTGDNSNFVDLVSQYEEKELNARLDLLKRIEKERKNAEKQTRLKDWNK